MASVYWRNGIAWGRVQHKGKTFRESLDTKDKRIARDRLSKWVEELKGTRWGDKPARSYAEAVEKFIEEHLPQLKNGSEGKAAKRYLISLLPLSAHFGDSMLDDIGSGMLSSFEQIRRRDGVTTGTIRNDLWCLSSIFTRAQEWEWVAANPVSAYIRARAKRGMLPPSAPKSRYCGHDEEAELLRRCTGTKTSRDGETKGNHLMLAAGIMLTIDIGLRKEELLEADWSMIDLNKKEWTVPKHLAKSNRARTIPILPRSEKLLRSLQRSDQIKHVLWHSERGLHQRYFSMLPALQNIATGGRSQVFRREVTKLKEKGLKLTDARRREIAEIMEKEAWASIIPDLTWHDLRRTCGCRLLQDHKMSMEAVSKWLGHSSIQVTEKAYAFLETRHLHEAVGTQIGSDEKHNRQLGRSSRQSEDGTTMGTVEILEQRSVVET